MTIYGSATGALRDTTKWITAALPVAALLGTGAVFSDGPARLRGGGSLVAVLVALTVVMYCAALWSAAGLLTVGPRPLTEIREEKQAIDELIGCGALDPDFTMYDQYVQEADQAASASGEALTGRPPNFNPSQLERLRNANEVIRDWDVHTRTLPLFKRFVLLTGATVAAGAAALVTGFATADTSKPITSPTDVSVAVSRAGAAPCGAPPAAMPRPPPPSTLYPEPGIAPSSPPTAWGADSAPAGRRPLTRPRFARLLEVAADRQRATGPSKP